MDDATQDLITIKRQELLELLRKALEAIRENIRQAEVRFEGLREEERELKQQIDWIEY